MVQTLRACRHGDVMLGRYVRGQPKMAAGCPPYAIPGDCDQLDEVRARKVAGKFHAAITSSRTKCRRIILGDAPASKWQRTASCTCVCMSSIDSARAKVDSPKARAAYPPSGECLTTKMISLMATFHYRWRQYYQGRPRSRSAGGSSPLATERNVGAGGAPGPVWPPPRVVRPAHSHLRIHTKVSRRTA